MGAEGIYLTGFDVDDVAAVLTVLNTCRYGMIQINAAVRLPPKMTHAI
jgi:hypothetical protein